MQDVAPMSRRAVAPVAAVVGTIAMLLVLVAGPGFPSVPTTVLLIVADAALVIAVLRHHGLTRRLVLGLGGVLLVLAVIRPPMQSHDVWSYVMYGRIVAHHHANPYVEAPNRFRSDPFEQRVDPLWRGTKSVYGPVFTGWGALVSVVGGSHPTLLRLGFQLLALAAVLAAAFVLDRRTRGDPRTLALVLLNPLVVFSIVNDAHVDALVGLAVLVGVLLIERRKSALAGAALGFGVLVKLIAILPAGAVGLWLLSRRRRWPSIAPYAVAFLLVVVAGYAVGGGRTGLQPVLDSSTRVSSTSVWAPPNRAEIKDAERDGVTPSAAKKQAGRSFGRIGTIAVLLATIALTLLWAEEAVPIVAAGGAVLAYMLLGAYVYPWYAAVGLFVLAIRWRSPIAWLLVAQAALLQLAEVPGRQFRVYVNRQLRFPDPGWHTFLRKTIVPWADVLLVVAVVAVAVVARLAERGLGGRLADIVGEDRKQVGEGAMSGGEAVPATLDVQHRVDPG